jgi:hypothetical protein
MMPFVIGFNAALAYTGIGIGLTFAYGFKPGQTPIQIILIFLFWPLYLIIKPIMIICQA